MPRPAVPSQRMRAALLLPFVAILTSACGGGGDPASPTCSVSAIAVTPATASVVAGATRQLSATITPASCSPAPATTWSTTDANVATVSNTGLVSAVAPGSATITASTSGLSAQAVITVTPVPVASVTVTLPRPTLEAGDTMTAGAVVRDSTNAIVSRPVSWSSSATGVAIVNATTGAISAVATGVTTIRATVGAVTGEATLYVAHAAETNRFAFAWANQASAPFNTPYIPPQEYSHNATGGGITVSRTGVGVYSVVFERMAKQPAMLVNRENVFVSGYGFTATRCSLVNWSDAIANLAVNVACTGLDGAPVDSRFTIAVIGSNTLSGSHGFAWGASPNGGAINASYAFSSAAGATTHTRIAAGRYVMDFPIGPLTRSVPLVTSYAGLTHCHVEAWARATGDVTVRCTAANATVPVDAQHTVLLASAGRAGKRWGFVHADQSTAPIGTSYAPDPLSSGQSNGQAPTVTRLAVGRYAVRFTGLGSATFRETALVSAYGSAAPGPCQIDGWDPVGGAVEVQVRCWSFATGLLADAEFVLLLLE